MIISQLAASVSLTNQILNSLIDAIANSMTDSNFSDALLCILFLTQTQRVQELSQQSLEKIISQR